MPATKVVNQIDEVVGVRDVLDKLLRCGAWFVQLGPVCVPQSKRFILCVGVWWAVCVISGCRQDSDDIRSQHNPLDKMDDLGPKAIADQPFKIGCF